VITFTKLTFKNFLSSGNTPVSINLNQDKTTLIYGTNGSGKSTILDAICYALFNKPFRSINIPQLINSSNKKDLFVEIEFQIGKTQYLVARGQKPKRFKIYRDGEEIDAKAADKDNQAYLEQTILKMNLKTFIQVVILGSSNYMPFMQLNAAARRDCIEDFLDIKVFSTMSMLAKERLRTHKDSLRECRGDISNLEYKIDLQKDRIADIEQQYLANAEELTESIESFKVSKQELLNEIALLQTKDEELMTQVNQHLSLKPTVMYNQYNEVIIKMKSKLESINKEGEFFKNNHECPSCSQVITEETKQTILTEKVEESKKYSIAIIQAQKNLEEFDVILKKVRELETHIQTNQQEIQLKQLSITNVDESIFRQENKLIKTTLDSTVLDREKAKIETLEQELSVLVARQDELVNLIHEHDIVVNLLKDSGIKKQIVRKYLPVMNKSIRKYLTALDFPILFQLDEEFGESVASPAYQDFSYASFSEGQKSRIDLSLMFTWREIGKLKNSVSTNLLILDEVFSSSLDETGKENLLALLRYGMDDNQNIVVVDHTLSDAFKEKFDNSIEVSKVKGFSTYQS
jgi:DNA repair exonuclease SbcCD ATPase subunit